MSNTEMERRQDTGMNIEVVRSLVKQYSELGQWTSALFWADAAAAAVAAGTETASGDDIWLLASAMLARGELHRAAHTVTSRGLHRRHLLCLGVAMRAYLMAKEPGTSLNLMDEADPMLLEPRAKDQTHNRALAGVLVWQSRALTALERREASAKALAAALRADCACYEALDLLLEHHALTPREERELIESLDISGQLGPAEGALVRVAYRERLLRYSPPPADPPPIDLQTLEGSAAATAAGMMLGGGWAAARLAAGGRHKEAAALLDERGPWGDEALRTACLVELKRAPDLFAFAHTLVDAYPTNWTSWFAVGCYYYLIGKNEFARRYLSKAKSLEPSAGCVWLAYGHSFAADNEHDQAMAAYFKASQLMPGCHLPPLYVAVECSLLNNFAMCERFLYRAATLHNDSENCGSGGEGDVGDEGGEVGEGEGGESEESENRGGWERLVRVARSAHVAHEAGAAALAAGQWRVAHALFMQALRAAGDASGERLAARWAATLDGAGHAARAGGHAAEASRWHALALALRPARAASLAAAGLALALCGRDADAAAHLHAALARDPADLVAQALLDAIVDRLDAQLQEEEIPQFPFPQVNISLPAAMTPVEGDATGDVTNVSDMSMSFD